MNETNHAEGTIPADIAPVGGADALAAAEARATENRNSYLRAVAELDNFRKRSTMYCGCSRFAEIGPWLRGLEYGISQLLPNQAGDIDGFREWLHMRLRGRGNTDWIGLICEKFGEDEQATEKFFEQFDLFRKEIAEHGFTAIIDEHRELVVCV